MTTNRMVTVEGDVCDLCEGKGLARELCPHCHGSGIEFNARCATCCGTGSVRVECEACGGTGVEKSIYERVAE